MGNTVSIENKTKIQTEQQSEFKDLENTIDSMIEADENIKELNNLIIEIGIPELSPSITCKNSCIDLTGNSSYDDHEKIDSCNILFNKYSIQIYSQNIIAWCLKLLKTKNERICINSDFSNFIQNGRFWYVLQTHFTFCDYDEETLKIIRNVFEVYMITLINVHASYFYNPFSSDKELNKFNTNSEQLFELKKQFVTFPNTPTHSISSNNKKNNNNNNDNGNFKLLENKTF